MFPLDIAQFRRFIFMKLRTVLMGINFCDSIIKTAFIGRREKFRFSHYEIGLLILRIAFILVIVIVIVSSIKLAVLRVLFIPIRRSLRLLLNSRLNGFRSHLIYEFALRARRRASGQRSPKREYDDDSTDLSREMKMTCAIIRFLDL